MAHSFTKLDKAVVHVIRLVGFLYFRVISVTKGTFHAKMGTIKDKNGMDLTKTEDIKKMWQEYTEELYKNI